MNSLSLAIKTLKAEAQAILDLIPKLTDDFDRAVQLALNCKGRFIVTGVGKSGHIGAKIAATLASTGTPSFFVNPLDAFHGDLGMFTSDDVVMAISYSGFTDELLRFIPLLQSRNIPIIGMTGNPDSLLAKYSTCHLNVAVEREACPLNLAPTSSTTATLAMGDALACVLEELRHFSPTDFAQFHPGGSLGRRLLTKVKDHMRTTDLPIVSKSMKISDAIIEISRGKLGIAIAVEDGDIQGVLTDGDVRRAMQQKQQQFFSLTMEDSMTRQPKTINHNSNILEAEKLLYSNKIHALLVTDDSGKLIGIIDSLTCQLVSLNNKTL